MDEWERLRRLAVEDLASRGDCDAYIASFRGARRAAPAGDAKLLAGRDAAATAARIGEVAACEGGDTLLARAAIDLAPRLVWRCGYVDGAPAGVNYHERSAATVLAGPGAPFDGGTKRSPGRGGFFYLREGVLYAPHAHEPNEIYAVVAGRARFWSESGWREAGPGDTIFTRSWTWHGMETEGPVLILWSWIGTGLDERPVLSRGDGAAPVMEGARSRVHAP